MRNFIIKWNSTVHFTHTDVIFPPSIARIISLSLCKSYYGYQCLFFFHKKGKKKRYSRFDVETKLTHWFLFFISVKFPRVANIHFLQSASNYVIRENFSKKKNEISFKKSSNSYKKNFLSLYFILNFLKILISFLKSSR